jgi:hypothetical protein
MNNDARHVLPYTSSSDYQMVVVEVIVIWKTKMLLCPKKAEIPPGVAIMLRITPQISHLVICIPGPYQESAHKFADYIFLPGERTSWTALRRTRSEVEKKMHEQCH